MRAVRGLRLPMTLATAISVLVTASAASAPQVTTYSRLAVNAWFTYKIDYGSNPDSTFNGTYRYTLSYQVNAIAVYDGRTLSASGGTMLADGGAYIRQDMTQWSGPSTRRPVQCPAPGAREGGRLYESDTNGGRFSGGGGVGVSNAGLTFNPGRAIKWSIGCAATEQLETHGLPGGPGFRVPPPAKSRFTGTKTFGIGCVDVYSHDWDPSADVPGAHKFEGAVIFTVRFTPFPASQLAATKTRLRDRVGEDIAVPRLKSPHKDCP